MMGILHRHFILAISLLTLLVIFPFGGYAQQEDSYKSLSVFPIMMYDSDIGFGFGAKAKFVDYLSIKESFDMILFGSTKGERLFDFTFSVPDVEIRQRKSYSLSFDCKAEYNKILINYFYGIGPDSMEQDLTLFTSEKKELKLTLGRGFTPSLVCEASYHFRNIRYYDVEKNKPYSKTLDSIGDQFSPFLSLLARYDTSDSRIHPTRGIRLEFQTDLACGFLANKNASFSRLVVDLRKYKLIFGEKDVLAFRLRFQTISGDKIPLFELSVLGGGSTENAMRGYKMNRFQDRGKILVNGEYRFPILGKLGGNVFVDCGTVWPSLRGVQFKKLAADIGWGLRYYLENFLARFDMGFSKEGFGVYFQFNHIF